MRRPRSVLAVAAAGLLLAACGSKGSTAQTPPAPQPTNVVATPSDTPSAAASVDPASVNANELGEIPVMMYHAIETTIPKGDQYSQTPDHFKAELQKLYDLNFRPITAANLLAGKIDIPAGKHPFVMTFDDGNPTQAGLDSSGNPDPNTGLGMMEAFSAAHPDWHSTATFYVNDNPFAPSSSSTASPSSSGGSQAVLTWLTSHGYDIGVHTRTHPKLGTLSDDKVQEEIGGNYQDIEKDLPGWKITSMALPFGQSPVNATLAHQGTYNGQSYSIAGVMLVGAGPAPSVFSKNFNPYKIPRIRSSSLDVDFAGDYWIRAFAAHPEQLYTSDGDPSKISFPATKASLLASTYQSQANPYGATGSSTSSPSSSASPTPTSTKKSTKSPSPSASATPTHTSSSSSSTSSPSPSSSPS